jgi:penicillin V acylase-like amidase (Ntn superfamily)
MCTIFTVRKNSSIFFCNNEDNERATDETFIAFITAQPVPSEWIFPGTTEEIHSYSFVLVGVRDGDLLYPQGGMNEHGLAFDINALPKMLFKGIEGKAWKNGFNFFDLLMINKSVSEVIEFYQTYGQPSRQWGAGQIHFADCTGNAMVVGISNEGKLAYKFNEDKEYLISTNFSLLNPEIKVGYPCKRYITAEKMLERLIKKDLITVEELALILDAVKLEFGILGPNAGTVYSNICDLKRKELYLYHYSDFSKFKKFNLKQKFQEEYNNKHKYMFADNAEEERFNFEKMQVFIIENLFK